MKSISCVAAGIAMLICCGALSVAQDTAQPAQMSEKALLAKARQLTQEELELSKIAVTKAAKPKVKDFAKLVVEHNDELDKKLTDLAGESGVTKPKEISRPMQERLSIISKLQGEGFDPDYLKAMLDMQQRNVAIFEELAKRAEDPKLRSFAREALETERAQLKKAQTLAAPEIPEASPEAH
jgi:putative membrane protein